MTRRARIVGFGSCAVLVAAGSVCAVLIDDFTGEVLTLALVGLGLVVAVVLAFLEIGLSEDRQRTRDEQRQPQATGGRADSAPRARLPRRPRRPG